MNLFSNPRNTAGGVVCVCVFVWVCVCVCVGVCVCVCVCVCPCARVINGLSLPRQDSILCLLCEEHRATPSPKSDISFHEGVTGSSFLSGKMFFLSSPCPLIITIIIIIIIVIIIIIIILMVFIVFLNFTLRFPLLV